MSHLLEIDKFFPPLYNLATKEVRQFKSEVQQVLMTEDKILRKAFAEEIRSQPFISGLLIE